MNYLNILKYITKKGKQQRGVRERKQLPMYSKITKKTITLFMNLIHSML
ncbi:unnamed protein product [Paramecium sonneborni]|uniref:Uncharacterized protein n=1 Tax=Paramecium sonneborni TaxID=65129 RepID=A0A8S1N3P2_9CILI|nr:unnamed protein product [Paramecium sonneborni]